MGHQVQDLHHYWKPFADRIIGSTNQSPKMTLVMQPAKKKKKSNVTFFYARHRSNTHQLVGKTTLSVDGSSTTRYPRASLFLCFGRR